MRRNLILIVVGGMAPLFTLPAACVIDYTSDCHATKTCVPADCSKGTDSDGDGTPDCEDPNCGQGFECVELPATVDWTPVRARQTTYPAASAQGCDDGSTPKEYFAGPATSARCTCTCMGGNITCSAPEMSCYNTSDCTGASEHIYQDNAGMCISNPLTNGGFTHCKITAPAQVLNPAACSAYDAALEQLTWGSTVHVCPAPPSGQRCSNGGVCVPVNPLNPGSVCVIRGGEAACPANWDILEIPIYESGNDTRTCGQCACGCSGAYEVHDGDSCTNQQARQTVDSDSCVYVGDHVNDGTASLLPIVGTPICSAPTHGTVDLKGPHKLCCR